MRRLLAWLGGAAGGVALYRFLARRERAPAVVPSPVSEPEPTPTPEPEVDPRADELRRRLAESRAIVDERDAFEEAETTVAAAEPAEDPAERRRRVHEQGRSALNEMRREES